MFDPKFERLHLTSSFIGHDKGVIIVEENDRRSLYPNMFKNVIVIYIQWQNLKLAMQTKQLMKITIYIYFNKLLTQVS